MATQKQKDDATHVMEQVAIYANNVHYNLNNLGLRLTFGELPMMEGQPIVHRVAVFIPWSLVGTTIDGLVKIKAEVDQKIQLQQTTGPKN